MTKVVSVCSTQIDYESKDDAPLGTLLQKILVTTIAYEDGRVREQYGEGEDWIDIKAPDVWQPDKQDKAPKVRPKICHICNHPIEESDPIMIDLAGHAVHKHVADCGQ